MAAAFVLDWLDGRMLPAWTRWESMSCSAAFELESEPCAVSLKERVLRVSDGSQTLLQTPAGWFVSWAAVSDIDADGSSELIALLWKRGSYGASKPFWVDTDEAGFSQHVCIYQMDHGALRQQWMSSKIGVEASRAFLDSKARLHLVDPQGAQSVWAWLSWGLTLVGQIAPAEAAVPYGQDEGAALAEPAQGAASTKDPIRGAGAAGHPNAAEPESAGSKRMTLLAVGDNIAHSSVLSGAFNPSERTFDFSGLYENVAERIAAADVAAVVQETPLVADASRSSGYPSFATPQAMGDALVGAGFDVVCAATNHVADKGVKGVSDTLEYWSSAHPEVSVLGIHQEDAGIAVRTVERNGVKLALFDATYALNGRGEGDPCTKYVDLIGDGSELVKAVERAHAAGALSVCFLHAGQEYAAQPDQELRALVERLIDAGADAVICSHPHVLQPFEQVSTPAGHTAPVFWSLGNFVANQNDARTLLGGMAGLVIEQGPHEERPHVASAALEPLVCHFETGKTSVYLLGDYTQPLAARHAVGCPAQPVTLRAFQRQWEQVLEQSASNAG